MTVHSQILLQNTFGDKICIFYGNSQVLPMTTKFYFTFKIHLLFLHDKIGILLNLTLTLFYQTYI